MWNHGPEMRTKIRELAIDYPSLELQETADILAFLFNATYFNDQGSYENGMKILIEKKCTECHSAGPDEKLSIVTWGKYLHPIVWVQKMWNHAPMMREAMEKKKIEWPVFEAQQMADLLTYVNAKSPELKDVEGVLPADPVEGRKIYSSKRCGECHGKKAKDLMEPSETTKTMISLAASMWNHFPEMVRGQASGNSMPIFEKKEMADLIAYIFTTRYFQLKGDPQDGEKVFIEKKCADCHRGPGGPPLSFFQGKCSSAYMITEMWNHGPIMEKTLEEKKIPWPKLTEKEMVDLMAYLNRKD
jgi:cytochrome c